MFLGVLSVYAQGSRSIQTGEQKSKPFTLVEPIDFIQQWMRQNRSVILIKEIDDREWQFNNPCFYRDGFCGDGTTRLIIARVEVSTDPTYKKGALILFESRGERDEEWRKVPYLLICLSTATQVVADVVPLTEDRTAFYVYGENTEYFDADELKKLTPPPGSIWEQMKSALP